MISAMPAVAVRRGRRKSKTFGRFGPNSSQRSSTASLSTLPPGYLRQHRLDSDLERQRRRFLVYVGTLCLAVGLMLVFIGVGAHLPTAQTVGLLLIGIGALLCVIKVFCSEVHATEVPRKVGLRQPEEGEEPNAATPLAGIKEQNETSPKDETPTSPPPNETQVLITNDTARY